MHIMMQMMNPISSDFGISLYRWMECNSLFQVINEPTRVTQNGGSILDLIITNAPGYFVSSGTCDQSVIYARMNITSAKLKCYKRKIWDLSNIRKHLGEVQTTKKFDNVAYSLS